MTCDLWSGWDRLAIRIGITFCSLGVIGYSAPAGADPSLDSVEITMLQLINEYRESNNLPCVTPSPTMNAAAHYMSQEMGTEGFFSHNEPPCDDNGEVCSGRNPFDRIRAFGHDGWGVAGENIAAGHTSAALTLEQWKNSPPHNEILLQEDFLSVGIGRVEFADQEPDVYWTADFSDKVDGSGDCTGEGPGDDAQGAFDQGTSGCQALGAQGLGYLFLWIGRRRGLRRRGA